MTGGQTAHQSAGYRSPYGTAIQAIYIAAILSTASYRYSSVIPTLRRGAGPRPERGISKRSAGRQGATQSCSVRSGILRQAVTRSPLPLAETDAYPPSPLSPPCGGRCHGVTEGGSAGDDQIAATGREPPSAFGISPARGEKGSYASISCRGSCRRACPRLERGLRGSRFPLTRPLGNQPSLHYLM